MNAEQNQFHWLPKSKEVESLCRHRPGKTLTMVANSCHGIREEIRFMGLMYLF